MEEIIQNLKDAGCKKDIIDCFMNLCEEKKHENQIKLLTKQRQSLLNGIHESEKKIHCIDYLIWKLNKENNCNKNGE